MPQLSSSLRIARSVLKNQPKSLWNNSSKQEVVTAHQIYPSKPEMIIQAFKGSDLIDILPSEIDVQPNVKLVCEDIPCMHINDDEHHVLWKAN